MEGRDQRAAGVAQRRPAETGHERLVEVQQVEVLGAEQDVDVGDEVRRRGDELEGPALLDRVGGAGEEVARVRLVGQEDRLPLPREHGLHPALRLVDRRAVGARRDHRDAMPRRREPLRERAHLVVDGRLRGPEERREDAELERHAVHATARGTPERAKGRPRALAPAAPSGLPAGGDQPWQTAVGARALAADELLGHAAALVVGMLHRRRLHEVAAGALERAGEAAVEADLGAAHGVDDDAGAVRRVDHLELELDVERHVAEGAALHADVGPLAVVEPLDVVAGADVHVVGAHVVVELAGDGVGLADLLGLEALALEHVEEVGVAADVELVGALELARRARARGA